MGRKQQIIERALFEELNKGNITPNTYREILDVCLAALEEPAQASEPTQTGLKGKFKNLVQVKKNAKQEAVNVPLKATIQPEPFNFKHPGFLYFSEPKDEYAEIDKRLNEIADKVNAIYAAVNKLKEPVINNVTTKMHLDDYPLTKRQLDQVADHLKSEIFKTIREDRLKGGFK